jgi:23S rRNA (adenine2030-N6)-methyltransferase
MNYRHGFHAGNFADVVKHAILTRILVYLMRKPAAFRMIDTHAGIGLYDLAADASRRTGEWQDGIGRLLEAKLPAPAAALLSPYLEVVRGLNPDGGLRFYPGSPLLARRLMRPQDRLSALELHPEDAETLRGHFAGDHQARIIHLDGWLALNAHLPPKEKRGLVLVDPPFEEAGEFERLVDGLVKAQRKFATGTYALWYPLKDRPAVARFRRELVATAIPRIIDISLTIRPPVEPARLFGTGLIICNPPFALENELPILLPALTRVLAQEGPGSWRIDRLSGE